MFIKRRMDKEELMHIYKEICCSHKKKEILPTATVWMDLEGTELSEISQTEQDKCM